MVNRLHCHLHNILYGYTVYLMSLLNVGGLMRDLSFANYFIRCRANPSLADKSAFDMYRRYQRAQVRARWFSALGLKR